MRFEPRTSVYSYTMKTMYFKSKSQYNTVSQRLSYIDDIHSLPYKLSRDKSIHIEYKEYKTKIICN